MDESGLQQERVRFRRAPTVTPELNEAVERNKMMEIVSSKTIVFAKNSSAQTASRVACAEMERNHVTLGYPLPPAGNISPRAPEANVSLHDTGLILIRPGWS